ncbi:5103_t:CDS:2 [Ambispora leptoticha]|uniref:3-hydroxyanthranilate 3,4-dioxygenase n=1 Tax=Ambispora leptoticha TaxID=144679 RepID=A0A9N9GS31_9GLOM|nr:5103_t:CDS:2 [Ambispora leptoticha]
METLFLPFSFFSGEFLEKIPKLNNITVQPLEAVHVGSRPISRALVERTAWHIKKERMESNKKDTRGSNKVESAFGEFLRIVYLETSTAKRSKQIQPLKRPRKPSQIPIRAWNYTSHPRINTSHSKKTIQPVEINNKCIQQLDNLTNMPLLPPINFTKWLEENQDKLKPPVNNFLIQRGDFIVMAIGGPNARTDYHINQTEEWFYQYKGDMLLKVVEGNEFKEIPIHEGDMFLLPGNTPHSPIRFADTVGIVIERKRRLQEIDILQWYCEKCKNIVYRESFHCYDIGVQLKPIMDKYANNVNLRTCHDCGHVNSTVNYS